MAHWLYKSEPASWSWEQQKAAGEKGTEWTGVRNYLARNNMRAMQIGDKGFFYHSNDGLEIVGIVEVSALSQPDSTAKGDPKFNPPFAPRGSLVTPDLPERVLQYAAYMGSLIGTAYGEPFMTKEPVGFESFSDLAM